MTRTRGEAAARRTRFLCNHINFTNSGTVPWYVRTRGNIYQLGEYIYELGKHTNSGIISTNSGTVSTNSGSISTNSGIISTNSKSGKHKRTRGNQGRTRGNLERTRKSYPGQDFKFTTIPRVQRTMNSGIVTATRGITSYRFEVGNSHSSLLYILYSSIICSVVITQ